MDNETSTQAQERKEKPLNELLTSTMVSIYVGSENTHWRLHERLLCYYSPFFADIFYADDKNADSQKARRDKAFGLGEEEDLAFEMFVGWLYSRSIKVPKEEKDVGPLLDLYLLSEKLRCERLSTELVEAISDFYYHSHTYPSLRRVQHVYANTDDDNAMREMMVGAVAKLLTTSEKMPSHWASALQRNGQLAVDIIRSIQQWKIEEKSIPDARDRSSSRGRTSKNGFTAIDREGAESMETDKTGSASNLGVESLNSDADQDHSLQNSQQLKSTDSETNRKFTSPPPNYSALNSPDPQVPAYTTPKLDSSGLLEKLSLRPKKPPDSNSPRSSLSSPGGNSDSKTRKRRLSVTFADKILYCDSNDSRDSIKSSAYKFFPPPLATCPLPDYKSLTQSNGLGLELVPAPTHLTRTKSDDEVIRTITTTPDPGRDEIRVRFFEKAATKPENLMLGFLWMLYLSWLAAV